MENGTAEGAFKVHVLLNLKLNSKSLHVRQAMTLQH